MAVTIISAPASEPVSLVDLKNHCHVDFNDDDAVLSAKIKAARQYVEKFTGKTLVRTGYELTLDCFPRGGIICLPKGPVSDVDWVSYIDTAGELQVLDASDYQVDTASDPARVAPASSWPSTACTLNAVRIEFTAGYGTASDVPEALKEAILLLASHWYENRDASLIGLSGGELPFGVAEVLNEYRYWSF